MQGCSSYFNKKHKCVGPLWQGRFKSWYVDESYLKSLVKYIEYNPIKAKMVQKIGQFRWVMSSKKDTFSALNYELIDNIDLSNNLSNKELQNIDNLFNIKLIGTTIGGKDLYSKAQGSNTKKTVTYLPNNGMPIYVRLFTKINGKWKCLYSF